MLLHSWEDTIPFKNCEDFHIRCCAFLWLKVLKNCQKSNLRSETNWSHQSSFFPILIEFSATFFLSFFIINFDLWQFCISLSHKDAQYLIWKSLHNLNGVVSCQECNSTFKVCYLHIKYLHSCNTYLVTITFFWL